MIEAFIFLPGIFLLARRVFPALWLTLG